MMGMGQPYPLMPQITVGPTEFLSVNGMVTPDVLVDDEEYKEVSDLACSGYAMLHAHLHSINQCMIRQKQTALALTLHNCISSDQLSSALSQLCARLP